MTRYLKLWLAFFFAALLAGCGGGGGSPGAVPGASPAPVTGASPTQVATAQVVDVALFTDKSVLSNSGTDTVVVTVIAVNANRNVVPGATVVISTDKNSVFTPGGSTTDDSGTLSGKLTVGADRSNRTVTISASVNGISRQTTVQVSDAPVVTPGQTVAADFALLTDKPSIANTGTDSAVLTVVAVDANRNVVSGAAVSVAAGQNAIFTPTGTSKLTDAAGLFTGKITAGSDKSLRTIVIQVTVSSIVKQVTLDVVFPPTPTPSNPTPTSTTPTGPVVVPVTDIVLFMDKASMNNSGTDKAQLTAIALDVNRNVVSGATVLVTTDQNSVFVPTAGA